MYSGTGAVLPGRSCGGSRGEAGPGASGMSRYMSYILTERGEKCKVYLRRVKDVSRCGNTAHELKRVFRSGLSGAAVQCGAVSDSNGSPQVLSVDHLDGLCIGIKVIQQPGIRLDPEFAPW